MSFTNNFTNLCNLVVIGSVGICSVMSSVDKTDSQSTSSTCLPCQLRRSSSEISYYIIDPIPQFSEEHRNLVVDSWHFITDHISEVGRENNCYCLHYISFGIMGLHRALYANILIVGWDECFYGVFQGIS